MAACAIVIAAALALTGMTATAQETAQQPPPAGRTQQSDTERVEALKTELAAIEGSYRESIRSEQTLVALKDRLAPLRDQVNELIEKHEPRVKAIQERAAQIPPPPAAGAAEEDPTIAAERHRLATRLNEEQTTLQQLKILAERANSLAERIRRHRREVFSSQLFARSTGLLEQTFWRDLGKSVVTELDGLRTMALSWDAYARAKSSVGRLGPALALVLALGIAGWFLSRWRRRLTAGPTPRRFDKALAAFVHFVFGTAIIPALIAGAVLVLHDFELMPDSVAEIGFKLAIAALVSGFGHGVAVGLFAPGEPDRRIVTLTDHEAASYAWHITWAARITALALLLTELHRILGAPVTPVVATTEVQAVLLLVIAVHQLWRTARFSAQHEAAGEATRGWLRVVLWLCGITMVASLATGYVQFSVFVATRVLAAFAAGGAVYVMITVIDAALTDLLAAGTPGGRSVAIAFGLTARGIDLITTLTSALLRLVIVVLAVVLALNASGVFTDDIYSALQRVVSDWDVGAVHVSPVAILSALACLIIGALTVRAAQRWLAVNFLPRTSLETGLQNSIVALSGYFALIVVLMVTLGILNVDLQKIALIAGALSVGIGFGLQSVVANFVSGLILLAERSIRVGDWVVLKEAEGFVRRISIRSTEIETFDRASVIIPNQEFVTGAVKNWTRNNTVGRVVIKVRVSFDSDVMQVRELLLESGVKHPMVLPGTPSVFIAGFGDIGIDFEMMCLISNVSQGMTVRTDLYMDILDKFRDARIRIPYPIHEAGVPALPLQAASKIA